MAAVATWPVRTIMGEESAYAVATPVTRLVAPARTSAQSHPGLGSGARVTVSHVGRALLVADQDVMDAGIAAHRTTGW